MDKKTTPPESADKGEASGETPGDEAMERFKHLTRRLLGVSNRQVQEERALETERKARGRKRK